MFVFGERLSGIELVELGSLVMAVLSVLVLGVLGVLELDGRFRGCSRPSRAAAQDIIALEQLVEMYQLEHGQLPDSLMQLVDAGALREYPVDPWGTDYQAFAHPDGHAFVVRSAGPDGVHGTSDDVLAD